MSQVQGVLDVGAPQWGRFQKSVAGAANVTLSQAEYENRCIEFTGALTGNISVFLPLIDGREFTLLNSTTGNFTLTAIGTSGTGVVLKRLSETVVRSDGTNIVRGSSSTTSAGVPVSEVADANVAPALAYLHRIDVPDAATGNVDVVLTYKSRVVNAWVVKTAGAGGASDTITVSNGATAITDAMSINVADKVVVRAATIDDAQWEVAAGGTLRVVRTKVSAANVACTVFVEVVLVA